MSVLQSVVTSVVVPIFLLAAVYVFNGRLNRLEARTDRTVHDLAALAVKVAALPTRDEVTGRFDRVESQLDSLRADLTQIALAIGAHPRPQTG